MPDVPVFENTNTNYNKARKHLPESLHRILADIITVYLQNFGTNLQCMTRFCTYIIKFKQVFPSTLYRVAAEYGSLSLNLCPLANITCQVQPQSAGS